MGDDRRTEGVPAWQPAADALRAVEALAQSRGVAVGHDAHAALDVRVAGDRERLAQLLAMVLVRALFDAHAEAQVALVAKRAAPGRLRYEVQGVTGVLPGDTARALAERLGAALDEGPPLAVEVAIAATDPDELAGGSWLTTEAPRQTGASDAKTAVVLCIDDNPTNIRLLAGVLARRPGIEAIFASDASEALRLAQERRPDLILLDLHLPDLPGKVVLERLRADPATAGMPVAIVTAEAVPEREAELLQAGADAFVAKPFDIPELLETVDRLLAR